MPLPTINPPLLNSANPWCTTKDDLEALYHCPHTGAVTTRTGLVAGFAHNPAIHQHTFFDPRDHGLVSAGTLDYRVPIEACGSLNTLGYSPMPLQYYLDSIEEIARDLDGGSNESQQSRPKGKPFIVSVTGSAQEVAVCYERIAGLQRRIPFPLCMEINLSCPNIPDKPPPAYNASAVSAYLRELLPLYSDTRSEHKVAIGIKVPPYTYTDQFQTLIKGLIDSVSAAGVVPLDFITATNTLGSCLLLTPDESPALASASGAGVGGMAGAPLHPLALGNVKTLRKMLDEYDQLKGIDIIGVGGVGDGAGFDRMRSVGAKVVGVGTALGREGVAVFGKIIGVSKSGH